MAVRWVRVEAGDEDVARVAASLARRVAALSVGDAGEVRVLSDRPAVRSGSSGRRRRGVAGGKGRRADAATIARWVRKRPGGRASPGEIRARFGMSEGTLRARRPALLELGVRYVELFELSHYQADDSES